MPIVINDITNTENTGVFDALMASIDKNLITQFNEGRITGGDYATVYLGAMQVAMQEAIQFVNVAADTAVKEAQSTQDLALKQAQQDLVEQQALMEQQKIANAVIEATILTAKKLKIDAEIELLNQKEITEWAQTELDSKAGAINGLTGTQMTLYSSQANGFKHKAAYDATKILADMWSVAETQGGALPDLVHANTPGALLNMIMELYQEADASGSSPPNFSAMNAYADFVFP